MKQSKTTLKELTAAYRAVLRHGILCNAIALGLITMPVMASEVHISGNVEEPYTLPNGDSLTIEGNTTFNYLTSDYGALTVNGGGSIYSTGGTLTFSGNKSTSHGAGLYFKDQSYGHGTEHGSSDKVLLESNTISFMGNQVLSSATSASGGAVFSTGGSVSFLATNLNSFMSNHMNATVEEGRLYKTGGGAVANQSYEIEGSTAENQNPIDADMVIGRTYGNNWFISNSSKTNGGAIMNRAVDYDGDATLTINGTTRLESNHADIHGGAIYNIARNGRNATVNMTNGTYSFNGNTADANGGAVYNEGTLSLSNATFGDTSANTAKSGGAIYNKGRATITDSTFIGNSVLVPVVADSSTYKKEGVGGAIASAGNLTITDSTFRNNTALTTDSGWGLGGALSTLTVYGDTAEMTITGSTFTGNEADVGGAVYGMLKTPGLSYITISGSTFNGNRARSGAAIANFDRMSVTNGTFTGNETFGEEDGGTIFLGSDSVTSFTGGSFINNTSDEVGGAIATRKITQGTNTNATLDITGTTFKGNSAATTGGAIDNNFYNSVGREGSVYVSDATFGGTGENEGNSAANGGAIYNHANGTQNGSMYLAGTNFIGNTATQNGGAIYNEGIVNVNGTTKFSNNKANGTYTPVSETAATYTNGKGGAIFNTGTLTVGGDFENNTALHGGAIYNSGALTISDGSSFDGNYANVEGGAIANYGNLNIGSNVTFNNNSAFIKPGDLDVSSGGSEMGAAIYSEGTGVTRTIGIGNNVKFTNNYSPFGNLYLFNSNNVTIGNNVEFRGNTSEKAASIRTSSTGAGNSTITIGDNAKFISNTVTSATGGAALRLYGDDTVTIGKGALVSDNTGTAIYNGGSDITFGSGLIVRNNTSAGSGTIYNKGLVNLNGSSSFIGNTAANAGAIYNEATGEVNLVGTHTFRNNKAGNVANDIHNLGALNITSGTTTVDGGITGTGHLTIDSGAKLNLNSTSIAQNIITLNGEMTATLNTKVDDIDSDESVAQIIAQTFNGSNGTLTLTMAETGTYHVFGGTTELDAIRGVWNVTNADTGVAFTNSKLFDLTWNGGYVTAETKAVENIASENGIAVESAAVISNVIDSASNSSSQQMKDLSVKLQDKLAQIDTNPAAKAEVEHATKAIHPEKESVTQSVASSVQNTVVNLASTRMAKPMRVGRNGGDVKLTSGGVWAQGLFNKSKQNDAFSGYTRGIALGLDGTLNKHWTIGAGYSYAHSDINGSARDTEVDSNTVFVYGQYKPAQWYLNAIANYTSSDYSEKGTVVDNTMVFGDYSVDSFGGSLATGYDFKNGITPELGLRYMHVTADDYANSYGVKTHMDDADYLTGILGAKYTFKVVANKHTTFVPQLNAGIKYDLMSDKNVATVTMPGVNAYTLDGERLNRVGGEFGIGLGVQYGNLEVSANYDIDVREDYTSQTGMLKFRTNF